MAEGTRSAKKKKKNICSTCMNTCPDEETFMECSKCKNLYHFNCIGMPEEIYQMAKDNNIISFGFKWNCKECCTKEIISTSIKHDIVKEIKEIIPEVIISELNKLNNQHQSNKDQSVEPLIRHTLLLQPKDKTQKCFTNQTWAQKVQGTFKERLKDVPVNKTVLTSTGMGYLVFPNKETRDLAAEHLN